MDLARLGIEIDTLKARLAKVELDAFAGAAGRAEKAAESFERGANGAANAAGRVGGAAAAAASVMGKSSVNVGNLAAQFQDIGVSAAMSMNPLQIALQQGTQISAVLGPMGAAGAVKALGAAFVSVLSPVSLFTIGIVALVAVGLQAVDWAKAGAFALRQLADVLVVIAPYAAAAAAGLALLYAPAIIGGIVSLIALLGRLAVAATIAAVAMAAANPATALLAGFALVTAAAVIFRDQLTKLLGFDLAMKIREGINFIVGSFVGAFQGIKATWSLLPAAMGDIVISTANRVIQTIANMINSAIGLVNSLVEKANKILPTKLGSLGEVSFGNIDNPFAGAAAEVGGAIQKGMADNQGIDWVGKGLNIVTEAASAGAAKLKEWAASLTGAGEATKKQKAELEALKESVMTVTELEQHNYEKRLAAAAKFNAAKLLNDKDYYELTKRLNQQHTLFQIQSALGAAGAISGALGQLFQDNKAFAIANAVINTAESITKTLSQYGYTPLGIAFSAAAAIQGAAQIAAITRAQPGSGSAPSVSGAAAAPAQAAAPASSGQALSLTIVGDQFGREAIERIVERINAAAKDGVRIERIAIK